jgi:DNA-3-methyladenine glycosylase II
MRTLIDTNAALKHFTKVDPTMAQLLILALSAPYAIAIPTPKHPNDYFSSIVNSIVSQQISIKAAEAVFGRITSTLKHITPESVAHATPEQLRACGLSRQKISYVQKSAAIWPSLHTHQWSKMSDEEVITELTQLYGIGRWTAEMFLIFSLARPDVFSRGDLGLMNGLFSHYPSIRPHHTRKLNHLIEQWAPHRTTAALTLWWHKDGGPLLL